MDLTLKRMEYLEDGIFGELYSPDGLNIFQTLEHAYEDNGTYLPKVSQGLYTCVRGQHQLASMKSPFETFEILNVPNHTKILFHVGNFNNNSEGCVLLGLARGPACITSSREAFTLFMNLQKDSDFFQLTVL